MEIRRIQKTGGSSFTVTLPKDWISLHGLKGRDSLRIQIQNQGSLLVQPVSLRQQIQKVQLNVKNLTREMITREAMALYVAGADEIECVASQITSAQRQNIRHATQKLLGFEVVSESSQKMVLCNIFDTSKLPIAATVEKMFTTTQAMFADAITAASTRDVLAATDVIDRDREIDKLYLAIGRQFHALLSDKMSADESELNKTDLYYYSRIARRLERIADHSVKIAQTIQQKLEPTHIRVHKKIALDLDRLLTIAKYMVRHLDKTQAHQILNTDVEMLVRYQQKSSAQKNPMDTRIEISLDRVHANITNIAEATLDYVAARQLNQ
jgi:phosphate uptake regulator